MDNHLKPYQPPIRIIFPNEEDKFVRLNKELLEIGTTAICKIIQYYYPNYQPQKTQKL